MVPRRAADLKSFADVALMQQLENLDEDETAIEQSSELDDEYLERLRFFFDDSLILAAIDLVDHDSVIKFSTPWNREQYQVLGSTSSYTVFPGHNHSMHKVPPYCSCPAYAYSVLISKSQSMCKHILAVRLAKRLSKCIERPVNADDLAGIMVLKLS